MKETDVVKFKEPANPDEVSTLMIVREMTGEHVPVSDLRFTDWEIQPTSLYLAKDLEVVEKSNPLLKPAKFKLEALGYDTFDGFTKGELWNGWDCPYFTSKPTKFWQTITNWEILVEKKLHFTIRLLIPLFFQAVMTIRKYSNLYMKTE